MATNPLLRLKGNLQRRKNTGGGGFSLGENKFVHAFDLERLIDNLKNVRDFFIKHQDFFAGCLVNANYYTVVSKSKRISRIFPQKNYKNIVGIKFGEQEIRDRNHIFTYLLSFEEIDNAIKKLKDALEFLNDVFGGSINPDSFKDYICNIKNPDERIRIIIDASNVQSFNVPSFNEIVDEQNVVTFYNVGRDPKQILSELGVSLRINNLVLDQFTYLLSKDDLEICIKKADYLISMAVSPFSIYDFSSKEESDENVHIIPHPSNEPTIGVIDTVFDEKAYFHEWVDARHYIKKEQFDILDKVHSTKVCSLIVDGPSLNPELDDGCGRFKVRLFEVAVNGKNNSIQIMEWIEEIIKNNQDIRVWNLSLGSDFEISKNFISPGAYSLDRLQSQYNVIFVVSATNENDVKIGEYSKRKIGSPADSINSLVVGSCNFDKKPASYSRQGGVLSFFIKPDVLYYGGDYLDRPIITNNGFKDCKSQGTSFAAPWISRKLSYLIDILGFDRETAKALIIDAAIGWNPMPSYNTSLYEGYGVVPIKINDIVNSKEDEIRFYFRDVIKTYSTGTLMIPVPVNEKNKFPFNIKATLCYFSDCNRNQGVDYTLTEMDLRVGVVNNAKIKTINKNIQSDEGSYIKEELARDLFRKWDTVKHISEKLSTVPRKVYETNKYGFEINTKERFFNSGDYGYNFALIITLKEQKGLNRCDQFIRECQSSGWVVVPVDIEETIDVYNELQDDIKFDN